MYIQSYFQVWLFSANPPFTDYNSIMPVVEKQYKVMGDDIVCLSDCTYLAYQC